MPIRGSSAKSARSSQAAIHHADPIVTSFLTEDRRERRVLRRLEVQVVGTQNLDRVGVVVHRENELAPRVLILQVLG